MENEVTLRLNTTPDHFANWLFKATANPETIPSNKEGCYWVLTRAEMAGPTRIGVPAIYSVATGEDTGYVLWTDTPHYAIAFEVTPLASERIQVEAECEPMARAYFLRLLRSILEAWPESAPDIRAWLQAQGLLEKPQPAATKPKAEGKSGPSEGAAGEDEILAIIRDKNDRDMVRLWREGYTAEQIAEEMSFTPKTVNNRICELRKTFGDNVVPYRSRRRLSIT